MWFAGGALWGSIYGTFVLNFCDFTRSAVSKKAVVRGNFWGIPINMLLFGAIVVMAGAQRAVEAIIEQALLAVSEDKAEVIVLGCGGMAGLDEEIRRRAGVPVVDGVAAAVTIAESLVRLQLSTSKVRT